MVAGKLLQGGVYEHATCRHTVTAWHATLENHGKQEAGALKAMSRFARQTIGLNYVYSAWTGV
jgi:hypothetical protein